MTAAAQRTGPAGAGPRIRYTVGLQEAVVERLLRGQLEAGDRSAYERYRRAADWIYIQHVHPEARREAFRILYARFFEELDCGRPVAEAVRAFTSLIADVLVSRAWTRAEEGAELSQDRRTLGLRILPARFASALELERFLHHERGHVADMLDEAFGYGSGLPEGPAGATRPMGERFGFLWDCSIDGRTARAGGVPWRTRDEYQKRCGRFFPSLSPAATEVVVNGLWEGERPAYPSLIRMAEDPVILAAWAGTSLADQRQASDPIPGAPCPLCGFPTHDWTTAIDPAVSHLIQEDFPAWHVRQGACERCVEGYALRQAAAR